MKRWQLVVLIFELALFATILILPQVALPDFTFHGGTAPVAAHSRICHWAQGNAIAVMPQILFLDQTARSTREIAGSFSPPRLGSLLSHLCVLLC
ncbi:MAG TPA: hypothetical protein VK579_17005 [Terriglobales bacterium]|nr:hypothetical protein [Terriglobales bacterium]